MSESILKTVEDLSKNLPKFSDGRIDYTNAQTAAVLNVFVEFDGKFLILKRSDKVGNYKGKWATIAGYLDELKPIEEKVLEELGEEIGLGEEFIFSVSTGKIFSKTDSGLNKTWIVCPVIVKLKKLIAIKLDWEHTEFKWIRKEELTNFDLMDGVLEALKNLEYY